MPPKSRHVRALKLGPAHYSHPDRFGHWLGYEIVRVDRRRHLAWVELVIRADHLSPARRVHGGAIAAFFDWACGCAVFLTLGPGEYCSTVELKVNYFAPLVEGDHIRARAQVEFVGNRLRTVHARAFRVQGRRVSQKPVAMATATFHVATPRQGIAKSAKPKKRVRSERR